MSKFSFAATCLTAVAIVWQPYAHANTLGSSMGIYTYPSQGQSPEQQSRDDYECFAYAKGQTGYDPMNPPQVTAQESTAGPGDGERVRGAARGAAGGAIVGAIAGDTGKGAAIGATLGTMRGGRNSRQRKEQENQQSQAQAQQQVAGMQNGFRSAYSACIEARGYSAKY